MAMGSSIYLETVQVRWKVETISLCMTLHKIRPPPSLTSPESALELNLRAGITKPHQITYAINDIAQEYLPRQGYRGVCAIHTSHPSL